MKRAFAFLASVLLLTFSLAAAAEEGAIGAGNGVAHAVERHG